MLHMLALLAVTKIIYNLDIVVVVLAVVVFVAGVTKTLFKNNYAQNQKIVHFFGVNEEVH